MTDDRKPRIPRRDYAGRAVTPATGSLIRPPIVGGVVGECDSDDARVADVSTDGVVSVEVDPDYTPVQDIVAKLTAIVGEMSDDAREQVVDMLGGHEKRAKTRGANRALQAAADVRRETQPDDRWEAFEEMRAEVAECKRDRIKREKHSLWKLIGGTVSLAGVMAFLAWIGSSLDARYDASAQERIRIQMLKDHHAVIEQFKAWKPVVEYALGWRASGVTP